MVTIAWHAPSGRADEHLLCRQQHSLDQAPFIAAVLNAVPDFMLVLNEHRQIIAINRRLLAAFGVENQSVLIGKRPGEAIECIHSDEGPDGCGTAENCSACGAVLTILASQESGEQAESECRIIIARNDGTALDFEVTATPLDVAGTPFTIFSLRDISSEKRRQVLEHTFFHDVLNTVGGMRGIAGLLAEGDNLTPEDEAAYKRLLVNQSDCLFEEITQQSRLLSAEQGEYIPERKDIDLRELLQDICRLYSNYVLTPGRTVLLEDGPLCMMTTDRPMLRRVVGNMVMNALEAVSSGETVKLSLNVGSHDISIIVKNPGEITRDVQLRLFKRSFSTKSASGRGIGTYSMKLFGERYLGGTVGFQCHNGETQFYIGFPLDRVFFYEECNKNQG